MPPYSTQRAGLEKKDKRNNLRSTVLIEKIGTNNVREKK